MKRSESPQGDKIFDVCGIDVSEELEDRTKLSLTMQLANLTASTLGSLRSNNFVSGGNQQVEQENRVEIEEEEESDGEEPVLSGFGEVRSSFKAYKIPFWK